MLLVHSLHHMAGTASPLQACQQPTCLAKLPSMPSMVASMSDRMIFKDSLVPGASGRGGKQQWQAGLAAAPQCTLLPQPQMHGSTWRHLLHK